MRQNSDKYQLFQFENADLQKAIKKHQKNKIQIWALFKKVTANSLKCFNYVLMYQVMYYCLKCPNHELKLNFLYLNS